MDDDDDTLAEKHWRLRMSVYIKFENWGVTHGRRSKHLRWLLRGDEMGGFSYTELLTPEEYSICQGLAGVHGFAYYKMLLARGDDSNGRQS